MLVAAKKVTVEQFRHLDFEGEDAYYELINGTVVKRSAPAPAHQFISLRLSKQLFDFVESKKMGEVFTAPVDVYLHEYSHVLPDLVFVSKAKNEIIDYNFGIVGVPDLMVEIISPSSISVDRVAKKDDYLQAGVAEYWLIDPNNRSIEIYQKKESKYHLFDFAALEGTVKSSVLEGFELDILSIFSQP